jgi:hypothetical protein
VCLLLPLIHHLPCLHQPPIHPPTTTPASLAMPQWVAQQGADPASPLHGQVDTARAATGGHSRGGKLATLAFTGESVRSSGCSRRLACCCLQLASKCPPITPGRPANRAPQHNGSPPSSCLRVPSCGSCAPRNAVIPLLGAKCRCPHLAGYPELVRAAYLVDPVDVTRWSPESPDNPSGEPPCPPRSLPVPHVAFLRRWVSSRWCWLCLCCQLAPVAVAGCAAPC